MENSKNYSLTIHKQLGNNIVSQPIYRKTYGPESDKLARLDALYIYDQNDGICMVFNITGPKGSTWYEYWSDKNRDGLNPIVNQEIRQDYEADKISLLVSNRGDRTIPGSHKDRNSRCYGDDTPRCNHPPHSCKNEHSSYRSDSWPPDGYYRSHHGALIPIREPNFSPYKWLFRD
jgi:hypothetical protein